MKLLGKLAKIMVSVVLIGLIGWRMYPYIIANESEAAEETPEVTPHVAEKYMALGVTLSEADRVETTKLLKGEKVPKEEILYVDGPMVNRFMKDGSTSSTRVFSSVSIETREKGSGIQVEVVTPDKITGVSNLTYHNAAINSGATDMYIRIATLHEVDGSGALVGLYGLLDRLGVGSESDYDNTNDQLDYTRRLEDETGESNSRINELLVDLRQLIIEAKQRGDAFDEAQARELLDQLLRVYNLDISDDLYEALIGFMLDFSNSDLIGDQNLKDELDNVVVEDPKYHTFTLGEIDFNKAWPQVLNSLPASGVNVSRSDIQNEAKTARENTGEMADIIVAMYDKFIQVANQTADFQTLEATGAIYSHTFLLEQEVELSAQEQAAVNYLRFLIYLYDHYFAQTDDAYPASTVKELWLEALNNKESLLSTSERQKEALLAIAKATGQAVETNTYHRMNNSDDGNKFIVAYNYVAARMSNSPFDYTYDFNTQEVGEYMTMSGEFRGLANERRFSFESEYGVSLPAPELVEDEPEIVEPEAEVPETVEPEVEAPEINIDPNGIISREDMLKVIIAGDIHNNAEVEGDLLLREMEGRVKSDFEYYGEDRRESIPYVATDRGRVLAIELDEESKAIFDRYLEQEWERYVAEAYEGINAGEQYKSLIYNYMDAIKSIQYTSKATTYDNVNGFVIHLIGANPEVNIEYAEFDLNSDGTNELIFRLGGKVIEVFTYSEGNVIALFNDETLAERSYLTLYPNGVFVVHGSGGAMSGAYTKYNLPPYGNQLITERLVYYDFSNEATPYYPEGTSDYMTEAEFVEYMGFSSLNKFAFDYENQIDPSSLSWHVLNQ